MVVVSCSTGCMNVPLVDELLRAGTGADADTCMLPVQARQEGSWGWLFQLARQATVALQSSVTLIDMSQQVKLLVSSPAAGLLYFL
jgi:hypothetical protein